MKPTQIFKVLDLARKVRLETGKAFNPLFTGEAGLGKSEIAQQWVKKQREQDSNFGFFDLRLAYMEGPDFIGLPKVVDSKTAERLVTEHIIPKMWDEICSTPNGLLLIEEPNRANSSVLNCLMQMLTDFKIHSYSLPKGWIIAGCINPDSAGYDVNSMDTALRDRFVPYEIEYDHTTFVNFMKDNKWHHRIISFVESGVWMYKKSDEIGDNKDAKYISPRTFSAINNAELQGLDQDHDLLYETAIAQLGKVVGREYHAFAFSQKPVTVADILKNKKKALEKLAEYCDVEKYRGDLVSVTLSSVVDEYGTNEGLTLKLVGDILMTLPSDQATSLIVALGDKSGKLGKPIRMKDFTDANPKLVNKLKESLSKKESEGKSNE